jgi:hypothetical protein
METVAIKGGPIGDLEELLLSARRYIYIEGSSQGLDAFLERHHPKAAVERLDGVTRVDLMAPSYRIMPFELEQL